MPFGEYELSPSLIGLSLLRRPHPEAFQRQLVRASIPCYRDFTLDRRRSHGFASAAGLPRVFSLAGWSRPIRAGLLVSRVTQVSPLRPANLRVSGFHALWPRFPARSASLAGSFLPGTLQPRRRRDAGGLGSSPFARHYSGNHSYFLLLRVLRCFSSPRSPPA